MYVKTKSFNKKKGEAEIFRFSDFHFKSQIYCIKDATNYCDIYIYDFNNYI